MSVVAAAVALGLGQLVKAVTGFGSALVAMPVLLLVYSPADALLVMVASELVAGGFLVRDAWPRVSGPLVAAMLCGVLPGQWLGTELLVGLDPRAVAKVAGAIVAGMGASLIARPVIPGRGELTTLPPNAQGLLAGGAVAGFLGGLMGGIVGASGPPLIAWTRRHFEPGFQRAQLLATFYGGSLALAGMLLGRGADLSVLTGLPVALPLLLLGNRVGTRLAAQVSREAFGRATGAVLLLAGAALLAR